MTPKLLSVLLVALALYHAGAQGAYVQPASVELTVKAGTTYDLPFEVRNIDPLSQDVVDIATGNLTQDLSGYQEVARDKATPDLLKRFPSCLSWLMLPPQTNFTLLPAQTQNIGIRLSVPADARGYYGAVIDVTSQKPQKARGINVRIRFLVPIMLSVESGVSRKGGVVEDVTASYFSGDSTRPAGTTVNCMVRNTGSALTRYQGTLSVYQLLKGRKRRVILAHFDDRRIIPNATVALNTTSPNRLPSGQYHVEAEMTMEGQSIPPFAKDIEIKGDPSVTVTSADIDMSLAPEPITYNAVAGGVRNVAFSVSNSASDPIFVDASVTTPKAMQGQVGEVGTGEAMSLASWSSEPLTGAMVPAGKVRTLHILLAAPDTPLQRPAYFGDLNVTAKTPDGDIVGKGTLTIIATNKILKPRLGIGAVGELSLAYIDAETYGFTTGFVNTGDSAIEPEIDTRLTDLAELSSFGGVKVSDAPKRLLPLESYRLNGQLKIETLKDGAYFLRVSLKIGEKVTAKSIAFMLSTVHKVRKLTIIASPKEAGSKESGGK